MQALGKRVGAAGATLDLMMIVDPRAHGVQAGRSGSDPSAAPTAPYDDAVHVAAFYDEVLRELIAAMGAALFFGNLYALVRRGRDKPSASAAHHRGPRVAPAARCATRRTRVRSASSRRRRSAAPSSTWCSAS